jgi:hypothetical protein
MKSTLFQSFQTNTIQLFQSRRERSVFRSIADIEITVANKYCLVEDAARIELVLRTLAVLANRTNRAR